jgi:hypothetical protein
MSTEKQQTEQASKAAMWDTLMEMCGHWQDSSEQAVTLYQDDATRTCVISIRGHGIDAHLRAKSYFTERGGFEAAIAEYRKQHPLESEDL